MIFKYNKNLKKFSRDNRNNQTEAEGKFWNLVLKQDKTGYRFLRQKPIGNYILDFYCDKLKLGIEIDDKSHDWKGNEDDERREYLNKLGIKIIRYVNEDVYYHLYEVMLNLDEQLEKRKLELENM